MEAADVRGQRRGASRKPLWGLVIVLALAVWPQLFGSRFYLYLATLVLIHVIGAVSLHLIMRTGQISLGHAAFMALGAYTSTLVMTKLQWPFVIGFILAMVIPAAVALAIGPLVLRLKNVHFVLVTFAFGEVVHLLLIHMKGLTGGSNGIFGIPHPHPVFRSEYNYYYLVLAVTVAVVAMVARILSSEVGRVLEGIRDNDRLTQSVGVPILKFKVIAFVIGSALVGAAGSLMAHFIRYISPIQFTFQESLLFVVMNVVGGLGNLWGAIFGAAVIVPLPELFRSLVEWQWVLYGVTLILVMAFAPNGVLALFQRSRNGTAAKPSK